MQGGNLLIPYSVYQEFFCFIAYKIELISYLCSVKSQTEQSQPIRIIFRTPEFDAFYNLLPSKVKEKFEYVFNVVQSVRNVSTKFVKHLQSAKDLYEMRISVGTNEYRTILFAIDHDNVIESTRIILLNGFLKKSTKDYKKQIEIAHKILNRFR